jgi:hypothetical protein
MVDPDAAATQHQSITACRLIEGIPSDSRASDPYFPAPTDLSIKERDDVPVPRFITDGAPDDPSKVSCTGN